jgi:hypothetical protein
MNEPDPRVIVCQGPPKCLLEDEEAVEAQIAGCPWCRVITIHDDGSETVTEPSKQ